MSGGIVDPARAGSRGLLTVAALADLIAAVGLVLVGIAGYRRFDGLLSSAIYGWVFAIIAVVGVVCSSMVVARSIRHRRIVAVIVVGCVVALAAPPTAIAVGWDLTPNPAVTVSAPLRDAITSDGATELCTADDPGYGPDNVEPWTTTLYRMRGGPDLPTRIADSRAARDLQLRRSTGDDPDADELRSIASGDRGTVVTVLLYDAATRFGDCSAPGYDYGAEVRPGPGEWIVVVRAEAARREP